MNREVQPISVHLGILGTTGLTAWAGLQMAKLKPGEGLLVLDWLNRWNDFEKEVLQHYQAGRLKNRETIVEGLDRAVDAFIGLFDGLNVGKMLVKLPSS